MSDPICRPIVRKDGGGSLGVGTVVVPQFILHVRGVFPL